MKKIRKHIALLSCLLMGGCAAGAPQKTTPFKSGDYAAILPYESSDTRGKHVGLLTDIDIRIQLESGLMDLSKDYFSPSEVAYTTHAFLDYDELDATDGSRGLLGTLRDDNPNGLNPSSSEVFDTGNGEVTGPILVADLYELDFYTGNQLKGISIGLAVNDAVEKDGQRIEITQEKMDAFLKVTASKINSYLRERFNEIGANTPILVAAYELNTDESDSDKGGYVYAEYFDGTSSSVKTFQEQYILVPSSAFTTKDPEMADQFNSFKNDVSIILADNTYTTGQCRFLDETPVHMNLIVTAHGKTAGEILAVIQSVKEKLSIFTDLNCAYTVIIKNNGDTMAIMERNPQSTDVQVLTVF